MVTRLACGGSRSSPGSASARAVRQKRGARSDVSSRRLRPGGWCAPTTHRHVGGCASGVPPNHDSSGWRSANDRAKGVPVAAHWLLKSEGEKLVVNSFS